MSELLIDSFFSLKQFKHRSLWKEGEPVWSALYELKGYLEKAPLGEILTPIPLNVHLERPELISIGKGTLIEPGVFIQGPCIIGDGCIIRHGAYLRGDLILGDRCVVGHSSELKHSILLDGAAATHFVYVGDSILGKEANLGAGVKCANLRLDRREVTVRLEKTIWKTKLKKFGAVIGDGAQIGCNCVLNPGTLIGKESACHPLLNIGGYIPPRSLVKGKIYLEIEPLDQRILEQIGKRDV
ncbi:MAG: UDP-N-acetylglucosamine diphosphorylase [Verrucomicrobiota bacterium]|nr:UDP-N-acetylglucosamine diphosphorylase [Verrucomicrobiota bacterium]